MQLTWGNSFSHHSSRWEPQYDVPVWGTKNPVGPTWRFFCFSPSSMCVFEGERASNSHFRTGQFLQPQEQPKQKLSTSWSFPVCRGQTALRSVAVSLILPVLQFFSSVYLDPICPSISFFLSLCFFLQYSFCVFFYLCFISNWSVLWRSVSSSTVTYSVANVLLCAFPVLLHLQSLAPGTEAFHYSGLVKYLLQWNLFLLLNNMIDTASTNKWFICALRFLNQGDFSCNYSLLHEELNECNKYAINAKIHKSKCPRLFILKNMQVHSYVSPHVSGIMVCR